MISTLLVDLDNTLLGNEMEHFIPTYLKRLGAHMANVVPPERFITELLKSTQAMMENLDPDVSMEQAFAEHFYPALEVPETTLISQIEDFYANVFPTLQTLTTHWPEAERLIQSAFEAKLEVVIATNPLFPLTAIEQRLSWAGVPTQCYDYALITSYEQFHFAKPRLEYYAEILGRLGKPPQEAAMIGNDPKDDLAPAQALGMAVFHVSSSPLDPYPGGSLVDAIQWLEQTSNQTQPEYASHPDALLARHRGHIAALISLTTDLDNRSWTRRPLEGEWAPVEIICHLRDVEMEVNLPRVRAILNETDPHLSSFDTDRWAEERDYIQQSGHDALAEFNEARKESIAHLASLRIEDWSSPARHSLFGPTTLAEVVTFATEHDILHLAQLRYTLAADNCINPTSGMPGKLTRNDSQ